MLILQITEKNKDNESAWRFDALRDILKEAHYLFMMFHGSLRALLEKQPSGELARSRLYPFVTDYLTGKTYSVKVRLCKSYTAHVQYFDLIKGSYLVLPPVLLFYY